MLRFGLLAFVAVGPCMVLAVAPGLIGEGDTADFTAVGKVFSASAVLVGPDLVLTAKHVGVGAFTLPGYGTFGVVGTGVTDPNTDLGLFRIDNRGMALPYATILDAPVADGSNVTMVGYGLSGRLNADGTGYVMDVPRGTRRKAQAIIDRTEFIAYPNFQPGDTLISILRENGQGALANGDSGGGIFQNVGGIHYLVGINSFINVWGNWNGANAYQFSSSNENYFGSGAVSLSHASSWLRSNGATVVPEPSTLLILGGLGFIALRKRRQP